jgi:transcriptional regulator with XRE-family HTH domain
MLEHPLRRYLAARAEDGAERTQADLAERAGISAAYLSQILNGERTTSPEVARELSKATGGAIPENEIVFFGRKRRKRSRAA